jgi:Mn-dependent DtxR family transcriptional regulator
MSKPKTVQISDELFMDLCRVILGGVDDPETVSRASRGLQDKLNRVVAHKLYETMHDPTKSPQEREKARQDYLDSKGIPSSFRWGGGDSRDDLK